MARWFARRRTIGPFPRLRSCVLFPEVERMFDSSTLARVGAMVGDPGRARMLAALLDGRALTASELAGQAGVSPPTASEHLAKLLAAGLIVMRRQGRHRYHALASADVAGMLETMAQM